jgi:hypothetical protein
MTGPFGNLLALADLGRDLRDGMWTFEPVPNVSWPVTVGGFSDPTLNRQGQ